MVTYKIDITDPVFILVIASSVYLTYDLKQLYFCQNSTIGNRRLEYEKYLLIVGHRIATHVIQVSSIHADKLYTYR